MSPVDSATIPALHFPVLAAAVQEEWKRYGAHRTASDRQFDRAYLHVPNDIEFRFIVAALDAIYQPKRLFSFNGKAEEVPAFNVTLGAN